MKDLALGQNTLIIINIIVILLLLLFILLLLLLSLLLLLLLLLQEILYDITVEKGIFQITITHHSNTELTPLFKMALNMLQHITVAA